MTRNLTLLGAIMALTLAGCGGDGGGRTTDSGIVLMDSGTAMDTGTTLTDSGTTADTGSADTGAGGGDCTFGAGGLTGSGCFPRCAPSTSSCLAACPADAMNPMVIDQMCATSCIRADSTASDAIPPINVMGAGGSLPVDCSTCLGAQQQSCTQEACPSEFSAWAMCLQANSCMDQACVDANCSSQDTALNSCTSASSTWGMCAQTRAGMCFSM